jgi:hypothetical protein
MNRIHLSIQSNFEFDYLCKFEKILGHKSGVQACLGGGKKQRSKICATVPLNNEKVLRIWIQEKNV